MQKIRKIYKFSADDLLHLLQKKNCGSIILLSIIKIWQRNFIREIKCQNILCTKYLGYIIKRKFEGFIIILSLLSLSLLWKCCNLRFFTAENRPWEEHLLKILGIYFPHYFPGLHSGLEICVPKSLHLYYKMNPFAGIFLGVCWNW